MAGDISWWEIVSDTVPESAESSGQTRIEAHVLPLPEEAVEDTIFRAINAVYQYRSDPRGFHCIPYLPHPRNDLRAALGFRPLYLKSFEAREDEKNPYLVWLDMQWDIPPNIQGLEDPEREPPQRIQWTDRRQVIRDPNTGELFTTAAGEIYRGIECEQGYGGYEYRWTQATLPSWFGEAQRRPINEDTVLLDGETHGPRTLWMPTCVAQPRRVGENLYHRDLSVQILVNPTGWDEEHPHIGHIERRLAYTADTRRNFTRSTDLIDSGLIEGPGDAEYYAGLADTGAKVTRGGPANGMRIVSTYRPIKTTIGVDDNGEGNEDVDKPVMLYPNGMAIRDWNHPLFALKAQLDPSEINTRRFNPRILARFSQFGLW